MGRRKKNRRLLIGADDNDEQTNDENTSTGEEKLEAWILNGLDQDHADLMRAIIKHSHKIHGENATEQQTKIEELMTPWMLSNIMAVRLYQIAQSIGILSSKDLNTRMVFFDPMGGTGIDCLAMQHQFRQQVIISASDIDMTKVNYINTLLLGTGECFEDEEKTRNSIAVRRGDAAKLLKPNIPVYNIDVLYLDPLWPKDAKTPYMIGEKELHDFIQGIFEKVGSLRIVVCKVSKNYAQGDTQKNLEKLCKAQGWGMEEFWPLAIDLDPATTIVKKKDIPKWDYHENMKITGQPEESVMVKDEKTGKERDSRIQNYGGQIRFVYIFRENSIEGSNQSQKPPAADLQSVQKPIQRYVPKPPKQDGAYSLDVSPFFG